MIDINFSKIRNLNGSQHSAFEELICQIAHLETPQHGKDFIRKEGAGGDAGVECYWILEDEKEICWQAKYFLNKMNASRWKQIDKSFTTALDKHPNMIRYYICMPLDKTDSRKKGHSGSQVTSGEDEWKKHKERWEKQAAEKGREIDIIFWGKHEITLFLITDDPRYAGRALYWFNEPCLTSQKLKELLERSQKNLGGRYTPEFHIDLQIAKNFDGLCLNSAWWSLLKEERKKFKEKGNKALEVVKDIHTKNKELFASDDSDSISGIFQRFLNEFKKSIQHKSFHKRHPDICNIINCLKKEYAEILTSIREKIDLENKELDKLRDFFYSIGDFLEFLNEKKTIYSYKKSALLKGVAGIGKSHLLCDLCIRRLNNRLPTLFLLGSQYTGGDPINFIKEYLDLQQYSKSQVLGAIDALGESCGERFLIVIDAINEGNYCSDWRNFIKTFLSDLSSFENISILLSCRSTYIEHILPKNIDESNMPIIEHAGFRGYEHSAAEKYLSKQGISKPSAPILTPEFSNPLFLKTCCESMKRNGETSFPKGLHSISSLFEFYAVSIETLISKKKNYNQQENIVRNLLLNLASQLLPDNLDGLPTDEVRKFIQENDPNPNLGSSLCNILLEEGILFCDTSYKDNAKGKSVIRFTYQRFSDYFVALDLVKNVTDIQKACSKEGSIGKLLIEYGAHTLAGIIESLAIIIPEKYTIEIIDLANNVFKMRWKELFIDSVLWRSPQSFTSRTLELLNDLNRTAVTNPALDILLTLSTEPKHPWNANILHTCLFDKLLPERDALWSVYIARHYSSEQDNGYESIVRTLIEWSYDGEISDAEKERIELCSITLLWMLTTPNRTIRDRATKSLVRILTLKPKLLKPLLIKFSTVNDHYLVERLFAVAYGVVCNIENKTIISEVAETTYNLIFKEEETIPHILLRDYARGIMEYALKLDLLPSGSSPNKFRPPYITNPKKIEIPSMDEIDSIDDDTSSIKNSVVHPYGDFGCYTMRCVHNWSSTPLSVENNDIPFNKEWAQRWVCKRAYDFGWKKELFSTFELSLGYMKVRPERVGKKYQWMAFHEFLARLSDNYHWINRGYSDVPDDDKYEGPWQIYRRDIDPTIWARYSGEYKTWYNKHTTWWQPYSFPFPKEDKDSNRCSFTYDTDILPDFSCLLQRRKPDDNSDWFVLHGYWSELKKYSEEMLYGPYVMAWFRINSIFIKKNDYANLENCVVNQQLIHPYVVEASIQDYGYLGEYPWHPIYRNLSGKRSPGDFNCRFIDVKHLVPYSRFWWEAGVDHSIDSPMAFCLPAKELIESMNLKRLPGKWGTWTYNDQTVFIDPSFSEYGPSYAMIKKDFLKHWLDENDMKIVWLIGGGKQCAGSGESFERLIYSGRFNFVEGNIKGNLWFPKDN